MLRSSKLFDRHLREAAQITFFNKFQRICMSSDHFSLIQASFLVAIRKNMNEKKKDFWWMNSCRQQDHPINRKSKFKIQIQFRMFRYAVAVVDYFNAWCHPYLVMWLMCFFVIFLLSCIVEQLWAREKGNNFVNIPPNWATFQFLFIINSKQLKIFRIIFHEPKIQYFFADSLSSIELVIYARRKKIYLCT